MEEVMFLSRKDGSSVGAGSTQVSLPCGSHWWKEKEGGRREEEEKGVEEKRRWVPPLILIWIHPCYHAYCLWSVITNMTWCIQSKAMKHTVEFLSLLSQLISLVFRVHAFQTAKQCVFCKKKFLIIHFSILF